MGIERKGDYTEGIKKIDIEKISARVLKEQEEKTKNEWESNKLEEVRKIIEEKGLRVDQKVIVGDFGAEGEIVGINLNENRKPIAVNMKEEKITEYYHPSVIKPI